MPFTQTILLDVPQVDSGEIYGVNNTLFSATVFEDGLVAGRFAKLDTGSIDNMDASVAPVIAGVVKRSISNAIEDNGLFDTDITNKIEYLRSGLITVDVITGITPAAFGPVFAHNVADANVGKATTTDDATTEPTNAEFIQEIKTDVWLIRLI